MEAVKISIINKIDLKYGNFNEYLVNETETVLKDLKKLNIFIGENNSGKSRFIRKFFSLNNYQIYFNINKITNYKYFFENLYKEMMKDTANNDFKDALKKNEFKEIYDFILKNKDYLNNDSEQIKIAFKLQKIVDFIEKSKLILKKYKEELERTSIENIGEQNYKRYLEENLNHFEDFILRTNENLFNKKTVKKVYIPALRSLKPLKTKVNFIKERTISDYWHNKTEVEVFTGEDLYERVKKLLLGDYKSRERIRTYESFLSNAFFEGEDILLIPKLKENGEDDNVLHIKIGCEAEQPIFNLGDGLQSLIILTFPLFEYENTDLFVAIEEPELFLHPKLQRKIVDIFLKEDIPLSEADTKLQLFLTTHSNHFLDLVADKENAMIFKMKKVRIDENNLPIFNIINSNKKDDMELLELLGVKNSSVFLANCTIWVEGISEIKYFRKYLDVWQKNKIEEKARYVEDQHYSFIEYGGSNITHWSFLDGEETINYKKISNNIFIITDSDVAEEGTEKRARQEYLRKTLGDDRYECLPCREVENLISPKVLLAVVKEYEEDNEENINEEIKYEDYKSEYLGKFIEEKIIKNINISRKKSSVYNPYSNINKTTKKGSGTIKDKKNFSEKAIKFTNDIEDLSEPVKNICKKLYDFIKKANS